MSLFPLSLLPIVRPVAAADYFLSNKVIAWFALNIIGIIPIDRKLKRANPLDPIEAAIKKGHIVILFPEGTRGNPEQLSEFKKGIWHLSKRVPDVPIIPIFLHGLGKALPRGEAVFVPFFCDTFVGQSIHYVYDRIAFMEAVENEFQALADKGGYKPWV